MPSPKEEAVLRLKETLARDREACRRADAEAAAELMAMSRGAAFHAAFHAPAAGSVIPNLS